MATIKDYPCWKCGGDMVAFRSDKKGSLYALCITDDCDAITSSAKPTMELALKQWCAASKRLRSKREEKSPDA